MSLINENDIIIPNTIGLITTAARENNNLNKNTSLSEIIRSSDEIYNIVNGRANGIELQELVDNQRISNNGERISSDREKLLEEEGEEKSTFIYESWFKNRI